VPTRLRQLSLTLQVMRVRSSICLAAVAALGLLCAAAPALASDAAATQSYLQADYRLVSYAGARVAQAERAPGVLLAGVRSECPLAAAGSPQDTQSTELSNEVVGAMVIASYRPALPAIRSFVSSVAPLRWSSASLTREVRAYAGALRTLAALPAPALCADVRAWAAGGFGSPPARTAAFDARFLGSWAPIGRLFEGLTRGESSSGRALAARAATVEARLAEAEVKAIETWGSIMNALELSP